jgi:uncharacterized protein (TIGR03000 family)
MRYLLSLCIVVLFAVEGYSQCGRYSGCSGYSRGYSQCGRYLECYSGCSSGYEIPVCQYENQVCRCKIDCSQCGKKETQPTKVQQPKAQQPQQFVPEEYEPAPAPIPSETKPKEPEAPKHPFTGRINLWVPKDAIVYINGKRTTTTGVYRQYDSFGLQPNLSYRYTIQVMSGNSSVVKYVMLQEGKGVLLSFSRSPQQMLATK